MVDAPTVTDAATSGITSVLSFLPAAAGLGTAAMGLVDSSKVFWGGPSNFGFGYIETGLQKFLPDPAGTNVPFGKTQVLETLRSSWLNGVAKADQKATAKALIHLELTPKTAAALAQAAGVAADRLVSLVQKVETGTPPDPAEIAVLGQFDVVLSAVLDAAYERADQKYRNACKFLALLASAILGQVGGWLLYRPDFNLREIGLSFLVGLSATPLAPVAKDLATSLQSAVAAIRTAKS
jgi:hypothetical protein